MRNEKRVLKGTLTASVLAVLLAGYDAAYAASGAWTGAESAAWTNAANWSVSPFPSGADTATFNGAGGGNTVIDLGGLAGILNVTFAGSGVAGYTLGAGGANTQTLVLEDGGALRLAADAAAGLQADARVRLGASRALAAYGVFNDSPARALTFAGQVACAASGGTAGTKYLTVGGAGPVTFGGGLDRGGASGLVLTNALAGTLALAGDNMLKALVFSGADGGATDIGAGELYLSNAGSLVLAAERDAVISGAGTLRLSTDDTAATTGFDYANLTVSAGKTLTIHTPISGTGGIEINTGTGTTVLNGLNTFEAHIAYSSAGTLSVSKIGNAGSTDSNLGKGSIIRSASTASGARLLYTGVGETSDRVIRLERSFTLEHAGTGTLTFASDFDVRGNTKTLTLQGDTPGVGVLAGAVAAGSGTTSLTKRGLGTWKLGGANSYAGATGIYGGGPLVLTHPSALAGTSQAQFYSANGQPGVLELAYDGAGEAPFNIVIGVGHSGRLLSGNAAGNSVGISHTVGGLSLSIVTLTVARASSILSGSPAATFGALNLSAGSSGTTTLYADTADIVLGGAAILSSSQRKTLRLAGTSAGNRVDGVISNGLNELSVEKTDAGTWTLTGANTYTGATAVAGGTLALAGPDGALSGTSGITLSGGVLRLDNTGPANADRLADASPLALAGGALEMVGGSETAGTLTVAEGGGAVAVSQGAELTFAALAYAGGTVDFQGTGLGGPGGPRILFATPPALHGGLIGPWAKVNGAPATYDAVNGITAYSSAPGSETQIDARGPDAEIPDAADQHVRITGDGTAGPITLQASESDVATLTQENPVYAATVDTAGKTLRAASVSVASGAAPLTLGGLPGEGVLAAPAVGAVLLLVNDSEQALTVNAALADNGPGATIGTFGAGVVALDGPVLHTGPLVVNGGTLAFGGHAVPQAVTGAVSGAGALTKTGTNVLHLLGANTYAGITRINAGILRVEQNAALGAASGGTVIASGATLDLGSVTRNANQLNMQGEPITVSGPGASGAGGAIVNGSTNSQYYALGNVTLAGDAVFGGSARWDIRDGTLVMNGRRVTKVGQDVFSLSGTEVTPGGDGAAFEVAEGTLRLQTTTRLSGGAANTVTVRSGARFELYQVAEPQIWTLALDDGATVLPVGGTAASLHNRWAGPVVLNGAATLEYSAGPLDIQGPISGVGSLAKAGSSPITISGTDNTYTGTTRVLRGRLLVSSLRNVGEPSSIGQPATAEAGVIRMGDATLETAIEYTGAGDTTDRVLDMVGTTGGVNLYQNGTGPLLCSADLRVSGLGDKTLGLYGTSSSVAEFAGAIIDASDRKLTLEKHETGEWLLSGNKAYSGVTRVYNGTLTLAGDNTLSGNVYVYGGALTFSGTNTCSGAVTVYGRLNLAGTGGGFTGLYYLNGEAVVSGVNNQGSGHVRIGSSNNSNGVMRVLSGAAYTGAGEEFHVGYGAGSAGALYVEGGLLARTSTSGDKQINVGYGQDSYGYLKVSGGTVSSGARLTVGGFSTTLSNAIGIVRMTGGTLAAPSYVMFGRNAGSAGILTVQGGALLDHANGSQNLILCQNGGRAELNLLGGAVNSSGRNVSVRDGSTGVAMATVNLCAGLLTANKINRAKEGDFVWVNFRGGTLKVSVAGTPLDANLTAVTLFGASGGFAGGAVIDTDGRSVTVAAPLTAPAGNGVAGIALADGGSGYIGEPLVTIMPPPAGGVPATAVAEMAPDGNGKYLVASVTVTCPGSGYTEAPAVTFAGGGKLSVQASAGAATLAPNTSGGLTKRGNGTLTLSATNTYTGVTRIESGTLKLGNAQALPTQTLVALSGGTLDLNGYTVTNAVSGSGIVSNGTLRTEFSPAGAGAIGADTFTLTGGATLRATAYLADADAQGNSDRVDVIGNIDLSGTTLTLVDPNRLDRHQQYTLLTCTGTLAGKMTATNLPDSRWHLAYPADGTVKLVFVDGMLIRLQ
jgi:autotransporter-associated beta strand protein